MDIIKVVIPAAGLGTRFLPFTKAIPKEMIPLLNKPAIQYVVEEGVASNVFDFIFITSKNKECIANHFDTNYELEHLLKEQGRGDLLQSLAKIARQASFSFVRQPEPRGLGHAIWTTRHMIGKEYFSILLPDDIIVSKNPGIGQLIKVAKQERASVIAVQEVPADDVPSYGIIGIKKQLTPNLYQVSHVVEKPSKKDAPSNLAIVGRYVLSWKIFGALEETETDERGELQLTDAISRMMHNNEKVFAYKLQGMRYDIGNPIGWIKALIGCALQDANYSAHIEEFLNNKEAMDMFMCNRNNLSEHLL